MGLPERTEKMEEIISGTIQELSVTEEQEFQGFKGPNTYLA